MDWVKKKIPIIFLFFLVYAWFSIFHFNPTSNQPSNVLGANSNIVLFEQPQSGRQFILDAINNAKREILVEVYLLSDKQVIAALEDANKRGVTVDVMLEEHPFGGGNLNNKTEKEFEQNGVSFKWTSSQFSLTHEKSMVIDGSEALILSQNLTASSFTKNREYDILDTNPQDVLEVRNIFIADWQRSDFEPTDTHLLVSPKTSRAILNGLISSATSEIDVEIEDINDPKIVSMFSEKAKNVQVKMLVPTFSQISSNESSVLELVKNGVLVKTLSSPYLHAKMIMVDSTKAYVGSVNLSTQSLDENRELGIIVTEPNILQTIYSTFQNDWNLGKQIN